MIRAVAVASLLGLLALVLYLPSAHPPEKFLTQLRTEHATVATYWGDAAATRLLARALSLHDTTRDGAPLPSRASAPSINAVDSAIGQEMASVNRRLFDNTYFRSIDALLLLAMFRLALLAEWMPWLLAFTAAAQVDGAIVRLVKAREFRQHNPEVFALAASSAIVVVCGTVVAFAMPMTLHPVLLPVAPIIVSLLLGRALASFHHRG